MLVENLENNFPLRTLIWGPVYILDIYLPSGDGQLHLSRAIMATMGAINVCEPPWMIPNLKINEQGEIFHSD